MEMLNSLRVPVQRVDARRHTRDPGIYGLMRGFLTPESNDNPVDVARRFLNANDADLGEVFTKGPALAVAGPGQLELDSQVQTPAGHHVRFQQIHAGVPVVGAGVSVHLTGKQQVHMAINDLARDVPPIDVDAEKAAGLPEMDAIRRAVEAVNGRDRLRGKPTAELVVYKFENRRYLAWKVSVGLSAVRPIATEADRAAAWLVFIDLTSGDVLSMINVLSRASGQANVFYPNPVVTLRDTRLRPGIHFPEYAYRRVALRRLHGSGYLSGKYVSTRLTPDPRAYSSNNEFRLGSDDPGFEEVMAYYWIDRVCSYLHHLGFKQFIKKPIPVNARGTEGDQSWYDPRTKELNFGLGGINDAEDADIILHEFGHAFLDALVPGWGNSWYDAPVRAIGEGLGDFLACCFLANVDNDFHPEVVGDWDARGYTPPSTYLRRVDGPKTQHNVVGQGTSTTLTADTLTDANAHWVPGALQGLLITPSVRSQGHPAYFEIVDNTATTIKVDLPSWDAMTAHGQAGDHYAGEEHQDGEFWSAVLWDIYLALGSSSESSADQMETSSKALKLVLTAHKYLDDQDRDTINFPDAADALLDADKFAWGAPMEPGPNEALLEGVLQKRKLL